MADHKVVAQEKWLAARRKHLAKEKEFTRPRPAQQGTARDPMGAGREGIHLRG